jgi:molecular chaperone DnaK
MGSFDIIHSHQTPLADPSRVLAVIGMDLGTTNSTATTAAWSIGSAPSVEIVEVRQPTLQGEYTNVLLPSVVAIYNGEIFVGEGAKRLRSRASELGLKQNQNLFYECKNDIGIRKTYHRAPEGYRSAADIGGKVLKFLADAAREADEQKPDRVVVTVPASFQAAQRQDTLRAAQLAGLELSGGDLLDEPVAAFLDYLITHGEALAPKFAQPKTLVVFDFGGGTCDVAVFRLHKPSSGMGQLSVAPLAVSRYHRLGGGDIDASIVHEVLIPQLCEQNEIGERDLTYEDKKVSIEPALLGLAEMLKIGLCIEIKRLMSFGKYASSDKSKTVKTQPGVHDCKVGDRSLRISSPKLSAKQFEDLLKPFLDQDFLYARETEYRMTCSVFAPLQDALDRGGIEKEKVDFCLAVGGSSLIPQVFDGIKAFFPHAEVLTYANRDEVKTCVSRGAAYHALSLAAFGKGLVQPICHDEIAIRTASGPVALVPKGAALPYPSDGGWEKNYSLAVPESVMVGECQLRMEVIATSDERRLFTTKWEIGGPVTGGAPIALEYRLDENQVFHFRAKLKDGDGDDALEEEIENPLTNVVNPQPKRLLIEEMEEELRTGKVVKGEIPNRMSRLAELYVEIGQREKGIEFMQRAIRAKGKPDGDMLNKLAGFYAQVGDADREEKCYREATAVSPWSGTWFNLALMYKRRGKFAEAADAIEKTLKLERQAPYLTLAAVIADAQKDAREKKYLTEAMTVYGPIASQSDWELGWFLTAAQMAGEAEKLSKARDEQRKRAKGKVEPTDDEGQLPIITPALARRGS